MNNHYNETNNTAENVMNTVRKISLTASNYDSQHKLPQRFISALNCVLSNGGSIVSVTKDEARCKEAFVILAEDITIYSN